MLAVGGETDTLWHSCPYANAIMSRLDAKGFAHPHEVYAYPQAGYYVDLLVPYQRSRVDLFAHGVSPQADEPPGSTSGPRCFRPSRPADPSA